MREAKKSTGTKETACKRTQTEAAPTPRKRAREDTLSPQQTEVKRPKAKKLKSRSTKEETSAEEKEDERAKPPSKTRTKKEPLRRARPEAVLVKPAQGQSYAQVLKDLKSKIEPGTLGVKVKGIRKTRNGDVLIEVQGETEGRNKLSSAIRGVVGGKGNVRELVPRTEVEILDLDEITEEGEIHEALQRHFGESLTGKVKVDMTKKVYRGTLKAFVELREELAARLIRTGHLKVGWVSCRVRKKAEATKCYRCHGYGHLAAQCEGPDRTKCCWRCGQEGHKAGSCNGKPQCYLCAGKEGGPRTDHLPGTMRCLSFREAAAQRRAQK